MGDCIPVGSIIMYGGEKDQIPLDWEYCDGRVLNQDDYPDLFKAIGHKFGQAPAGGNYDPDTQFFLPDLRGRFVRGVDDGAGRDPDLALRTDMQSPATLYSGIGSVQADQFRAHTHDYVEFPSTRGDIASGEYWASGMGKTGGAGGSETRPINVVLNFIIKSRSV